MAKLSIIRGDTYTLTVTLLNTAGTAFDLTGYKAFFTAVSDYDTTGAIVLDPTAVITSTQSSVASPTLGVITFTLSTTQTNIASGTYYYDVQIQSAGGVVTTVLGPDVLKITPDVTRRLV